MSDLLCIVDTHAPAIYPGCRCKHNLYIHRVHSSHMDSMLSESTLGIPKEVLAILAAIDGKPYSEAVWTLAKHKSGYSLKLFWGVEQKSALKSPNSAHPTFSGRSNQNRRRLEAFLVKKRGESSTQHCPSESPGTCEFPSVPKTSSVAQVCPTRGHDSESSSHDQSCTMVESTSLKEPASDTFDTTTNSATTLKLTQVDASSTGGHESGPSTLASSDDVSASQALPTSKVLHIDCPVSGRTRSKVKQHQSDQDLGNDPLQFYQASLQSLTLDHLVLIQETLYNWFCQLVSKE